MNTSIGILLIALIGAGLAGAETGFDQRYERDYNIFNPATQYQADHPLNPANAYDPYSAFNPVNRYDPGNPVNPANQYSPNNPFNPANRYRPDNPLNPSNTYNPTYRLRRWIGILIVGIGDDEGQDKTVKPRPRKSSSKVRHGT